MLRRKLRLRSPLSGAFVVAGLATFALAQQQSQPSQAEVDEARRQGEERSRQQREREQQDPKWDPGSRSPRITRVEGAVLMDGGGPPPVRVMVSVLCSGNAVGQAFASEKGQFSILLGVANIQPNASMGSVPAGVPMQGLFHDCVVTAELPGFQAVPQKLVGEASRLSIIRSLVILKPLEKVSGYTFSGTSLFASKDARKAHEKGRQALAQGKLDAAERELRRAVELHPKYAVAWYDLGRMLIRKQQPAAAREALLSAVAADAKYISPHPFLAQLALDEKRWEDVARHAMAVIAMNPFYAADIYVLSAQANLVLQQLDVAESHAREALKVDTQQRFPVAHRLLARILTRKGQTGEAVQHLRQRLAQLPSGPEAEAIRAELASLEQQLSER